MWRLVASMGLFELGMPHANLTLCRRDMGEFGKGPIAKRYGLTHYIDDTMDCLWSVCCDSAGNAYKTISEASGFLVHYSVQPDRRLRTGRRSHAMMYDEVRPMIRATTTDWKEIATLFGLPTSAWDELTRLGPPGRPFSKRPVSHPVTDDDHKDAVYVNIHGHGGPSLSSTPSSLPPPPPPPPFPPVPLLTGFAEPQEQKEEPVAATGTDDDDATGNDDNVLAKDDPYAICLDADIKEDAAGAAGATAPGLQPQAGDDYKAAAADDDDEVPDADELPPPAGVKPEQVPPWRQGRASQPPPAPPPPPPRPPRAAPGPGPVGPYMSEAPVLDSDDVRDATMFNLSQALAARAVAATAAAMPALSSSGIVLAQSHLVRNPAWQGRKRRRAATFQAAQAGELPPQPQHPIADAGMCPSCNTNLRAGRCNKHLCGLCCRRAGGYCFVHSF